jgi:hypothetical protein
VSLTLPFRRKSAEPEPETLEVEEPEVVIPARARAHTPSKRELGKATPKRGKGPRVVETPPKDRKEALRRARQKQQELRAKQREARAEARAGMLAGKEEYLPARDRGPERALVRDIVDSRRNLASLILPGALVMLVFATGMMPPILSAAVNFAWMLLALGVIVDSFLLSRRVKKFMLQRFPKNPLPPRKYYFYAIMRSLQMRRLRLPGAKIKAGTKI